MEGAVYKIDILVGDGRKTLKHVKIHKTERWDDLADECKERAEAAADRSIIEYPDHIAKVHEWPSEWRQVWYLDPA